MIPYGQFGSAAAPLPRAAWPGLPLAVFCAALIGGHGAATGDILPTVFIGSGIILSALYSSSGRTKALLSLLLMAAHMAGLLASGIGAPATVGVGLTVTLQGWAGSWILHLIAPRGLELSRLTSIVKLSIVALLVAPVSGAAAQTLIGLLDGEARIGIGGTMIGDWPRFWSIAVPRWILPHALGILLAVPIFRGVMNAATPHVLHVHPVERIACHLATLLVSAAVYYSDGDAFPFLIAPLFIWTSIRLGICDTALAVFISLMIASAATAQGHGPVVTIETETDSRIFFLDLWYMVAFASSIPIAATLEAKLKLHRALEDNLKQTRQIVENMGEIVFRTDARGRWIFLNPAWEAFTGYRVAESLGWRTTQLLHPDDLAETTRLYPPLVAGEVDELNLQQRFFRKDGDIRHIEVSVHAIRDENGQFAGTSGIIRDTTEFTHYVKGLENSERRFRELCDTAPVGIIRFDPNGTVTYANKRFELISLASARTIVGSSWIRLVQDQDRHIAHQISAGSFAPGSVLERDIRLLDHSHIRKWVTLVVTGEFDADGQLTGYIAAFADISQRKAAEAELAARTVQMRTLAENINDMVFRFSLEGICRFATPSVRDVLGLDPDRIVGQEDFIQLHPDDAPAVRMAVQRLRQGLQDHATFGFRALPEGDGSDYVWLEANCRLLRSNRGRPTEIVASVRDMTVHKKLERDLIDAKQKAESAASAKSAFLANLSHEIRTPMNGVIGLTELLATRDLDEGSAHYVRLISESGNNMMRLLNDILDMSKIDSGRLQIARDPFDLHECLANSLSLMTASAAEKGLELRLEIMPGTPGHIWGDSLRVRQILANLVGNAVKFTEKGQILLQAHYGDSLLSIAVSDTGIGIPPEAQSAVFEEFVQADARISHGFGGTGLGLPISRRLAEAMGGTLQLSSTVGQGTVVTLRIPVQPALGLAPPPPDETPPPRPGPAGARHVLVVEDNMTNQIIVGGMLERLGCRWSSLTRGDQVLEAVEQARLADDPFDMILMDLHLPGMDGCDAAQSVRKAGFDGKQLPIIAVTANAFGEDVERCLSAGMQGHIAKPVRLRFLQKMLAQY